MADRYWVGGTGSWTATSTTNWSATSGGAGGASAPTYADNVIFDTLSSATAYTVTFSAGASGTGSISGTTLTVTAVSGTLTVGASINRNQNTPSQPTDATYIAGGTYIVNQLTGTTGGVGTYTVSVSQTSSSASFAQMPSCADITVSGPLTGAVTTDGTSSVRPSIYGSMTLAATNVVWTSPSELIFCANTTGKTVTTNGVSIGVGSNVNNRITFDGDGGGWTLGSSLTTAWGSAETFKVNRGDFNTGGFALTTRSFFSTGTFTRSITLGSSTITLGASIPIGLTDTGLTLNVGTSTFALSSTNANFAGAGRTFHNLSFTATNQGSKTLSGNNTFNNLSFANRSGNGMDVVLLAGETTVNGAISFGLGTVSLNVQPRRLFRSDVIGTQRTLTLGASSSVSTFAQIDFHGVVVSGPSIPLSGTNIGNAGLNSGITFATPKTVYQVTSSTNWTNTIWATTPTGTPAQVNFPIVHDTVVITDSAIASGGSTGIQATVTHLVGTYDFSSRTLPITLSILGDFLFFGPLLLSPAVTITGKTFRTGTASDSLVISDSTLGNVVVSVTATDSLSITGTAENTPFRFVLTADGILTGATAMDTPFLAKVDFFLSNLILAGQTSVGQVTKVDVYNLLMNAILTGQSRVLPQSFTRTVYQAQDFDTDRVSYTEAEKTRSASVT